jgi:tetratricopeptide (TPR) repeat protein
MITHDYTTTFHTYILRTTEFALARVRATEGLLADDVRKQALHALSYALGLADAWPVVRDLLLLMAPKMEQAGHREDWMPYLAQGITAGERQGDWPAVAEYQLQLGMLYRMISQFEPAKVWLTASQTNFVKSAAAPDQARALNELAWVEHLQHRYDEATAHAQQALVLLPADHPECGMSYRVLGMVAFEQRKWPEAEVLHRKALEFFEQYGDQRQIAWGFQNLASALRGQQKFKEALISYQSAAEVLFSINDSYNWAIVQMNLGSTYLYAEQPNLALLCLSNAEQVIYRLNDRLQMARIYTNQGLVYLALHNYIHAENGFQLAIDLYARLGDERWRLNAADGLAMAYLGQGAFMRAVEVLEAALQDLPGIEGMPNYAYLLKSLNEHLQQARAGQGLSTE